MVWAHRGGQTAEWGGVCVCDVRALLCVLARVCVVVSDNELRRGRPGHPAGPTCRSGWSGWCRRRWRQEMNVQFYSCTFWVKYPVPDLED